MSIAWVRVGTALFINLVLAACSPGLLNFARHSFGSPSLFYRQFKLGDECVIGGLYFDRIG